jgi:hypothetical protein
MLYLDCLRSAGFDLPEAAALPVVSLPSPSVTPVEALLRQIRAGEAMKNRTYPSEQIDAGCLEAVDSINPFNDLAAILEDATTAVSDTVRADKRYLQAQQQERQCVASEESLDGANSGLRQQILDEVGRIEQLYGAGTASGADLIAQLEKISVDARTVDWTVEPGCEEALVAIERELVDEAQRDFLEANPGFIDGLVEKYRPIVNDLMQ